MTGELSAILEATEPTLLATDLGATEGPLWHPGGFLTFVDMRGNRLLRWDAATGVRTIREGTGEGNGCTLDRQGRLVMCEGGRRRLTAMTPDGTVTALAERWQGKRLNRPNDVVCRSDGSLFFTDPELRVPPEEREVGVSGVYRIDPQGTLSLATDECEYPNGLAFSPDERTLYVADNGEPHHLKAFDVEDGVRVEGERVIHVGSPEHPDGLKADSAGRLYATFAGGVEILDPDGSPIGAIDVPGAVNFCFGGPERDVLFITADTAIYAAHLESKGPQTWPS